MAAVLWLLPAMAAGRLGSGVAAPAPSRKEDTPLSQDAETADAGQYEPPSSFAFGYVAPALLPFAPPEDPHEDGLGARDGLSVSSQAEQSFAGLDLTGTTGLAFQCSLPTNLSPCATDFLYVKEGAQPVDAPNALPYTCYRTVVNENVHTLSVVALAAAAAGAPSSQIEDKHTFAISVPAVAAEKTKAQYDATSGAYSVKLFPADETASQPPVSFTQVSTVGFTSFVPEPAIGPGLQHLASKAETLLGGGMREIPGGATL